MAWKTVYNTDTGLTSVAKVPSNSVFYPDIRTLTGLYAGIHTDSPADGVQFGNGWLSYRNHADHETVDFYVYPLAGSGIEGSLQLQLDYVKKTKTFELSVKPNLPNGEANRFISERICFPEGSVRTFYASEVIDDLYGLCVKKVLLDAHEACRDYIMFHRSNTLEFEIEYAEELEKIKELAEGYGYRFVLADYQDYGKGITVTDGNSAVTGTENRVTFVSAPYGLKAINGDFYHVGAMMGYTAQAYSDPTIRFKSAGDMIGFIREFLETYHSVKETLVAANGRLRYRLLGQ